MLYCNMCVVWLSMKRYLCKGDEKALRSLEIYEKYVWELYIDTLLDMDLLYIYIYTLRDMEFKDV